MTGKLARPLIATLLLAGLAGPAMARPTPAAPEPHPSLLLQVWERLSAPFVALFDAAETDGRSIWDPDGLAAGNSDTENDGRGVWDPNG
jgi:hypothetical protein